MPRLIAVLALVAVAGCATSYTADNNIGMVKDDLYEEAATLLAREGIPAQRGLGVSGRSGVRVAPKDAFRATKILTEWRRGKEPGTFLTRTEFEMQLEGR